MPGVPAEPHPRQTGQGRPGPLISVVMPVHNGARYLDASVGSILAQTLADFEFVILDDASDDGFYLFRPGPGVGVQPTDPVAAADLHGLIAASLGPR